MSIKQHKSKYIKIILIKGAKLPTVEYNRWINKIEYASNLCHAFVAIYGLLLIPGRSKINCTNINLKSNYNKMQCSDAGVTH